MIAGGPEVQLGVAQPSTASDISEIERPNLKGVRASVFYSTYSKCAHVQCNQAREQNFFISEFEPIFLAHK